MSACKEWEIACLKAAGGKGDGVKAEGLCTTCGRVNRKRRRFSPFNAVTIPHHVRPQSSSMARSTEPPWVES